MTPVSARIFIVEDEALIAMELRERLVELGHVVCGHAARGEAALLQLAKVQPDLVLMDVRLAGSLSGIDTAMRLHAEMDIPVVFLTAYSDTELMSRAAEAAPCGYLLKPFNERELEATIIIAIYKHRLDRATRELNAQLERKVAEGTQKLAHAHQAIGRSEDLLQSVWETASEGMRLTTEDGVIYRVNRAYCGLVGMTTAQLVGQPSTIVYPPEAAAPHMEYHRDRFRDGDTPTQIERQLTLHDGRAVWVAVSHRLLPIVPGQPRLLLTTFQDISARKLAELAQQENEARLQRVIEGSQLGYWDWDVRTGVVFYSPRSAELLGNNVAPPAPTLQAWKDRIHPDDIEHAVATLEAHVAGATPFYECEHRLRTAKGEWKWVLNRGQALERDASGRALRVSGTHADITRRKQAEAALAEREALLSSINANLVGTVVYRLVVAPSGAMQCTYITPNVEEVIGLPAAAVLENVERVFELLLPEDIPALRQSLAAAVKTREQTSVFARMRDAGGRIRWLHFRSRHSEAQADGVVVRDGVVVDITAAKDAEAEIRRLALIAARTHNAVVLTDAKTRIEWVNEGFTRITGYQLDEVRSRVPGSFLQGPETSRETVAKMRDAIRTGHGFNVEILNYRKDGRKFWTAVEVQPLHDDQGRITHFMGIEADITERKSAEEKVQRMNTTLESLVRERTAALSESERRHRALLANLQGMAYRCRDEPARGLQFVSEGSRLLVGYAPHDLCHDMPRFGDLIHPDDADRVLSQIRSAIDTGDAFQLEYRLRHANGEWRWVSDQGRAVRETNEQLAVEGYISNITARKLAQAKQHESDRRYSELVENINDALVREDAEGRLVFANRRFLEWFGLEGKALHDVRAEDFVAPGSLPEYRERQVRRMRGEEVAERFEFEGVRADGSRMWLDAYVTCVVENGRIVGTQATLRDVTARWQTQQAAQALLRNTASVTGDTFFRSLVSELGSTLRVAMISLGEVIPGSPDRLRARVTYANGELVENVEHVLDPGDPIAVVLREGKPLFVPDRLGDSHPAGVCGRKDMRGFFGTPLRAPGQPAHGILAIADTRPFELDPLMQSLLTIFGIRAEAELMRDYTQTEQEHLQARLFQHQKFEALGTLAGGVAHDFNNILTAIINFTMLARDDCARGAPQVVDFLNRVLESSNRAKELVRQILTFSRCEPAQRVALSLGTVVRDAIKMLRSTLPATIEIGSEINPATPTVVADPTQIHQVIVNLAINAAQAVGAKPGQIVIRLSSRTVEKEIPAANPPVGPGAYACIAISDTGCGMDPATLSRIFEPFFTTKPVGQGTGLGLAVVHGIVKQHEGGITVQSHVGRGTTFTVYLPAMPEATFPVAVPRGQPLPLGRGEHILIVDDEPLVARSLKLQLERLRYRATAFVQPEEALGAFWVDPSRFDLVITDLQMPGMNGITFTERVLAQRPATPVIMASGYTGEFTLEMLRQHGIRELLLKPIELEQLGFTVARVLAARSV